MKKLLLLLFVCLTAAIAVRAQVQTCHIDGPANVRQQPNTSSAVMGRIKNRMVATVSHVSGNMWRIHNVYNPNGGSAYTGNVIGYYTHSQNLIFDINNAPRYSAPQVETYTCYIDGPANVRKQPNTKSAVMGSIRNRMKATVSHVQGDMWRIHNVYSTDGKKAYSGNVIGYYTHRQNLIF